MSKHTFTSYEEQWSTLRDKKPSDALELWTVPAYRATSEDRDGDYEEDQSFCAGQAYGDTDQVREGDGPTPPGGDVEGPRPRTYRQMKMEGRNPSRQGCVYQPHRVSRPSQYALSCRYRRSQGGESIPAGFHPPATDGCQRGQK